MKKNTSLKKPFAKKRANTKKPDTEVKVQANPDPKPGPPPPPPSDAPAQVINGPATDIRPCSPAETQKGHHEVIQS